MIGMKGGRAFLGSYPIRVYGGSRTFSGR
jgi:hypothetical protein